MTSPITVYNDVIAPDTIWIAGVRGKQIRKNIRAEANNGIVKINILRSRTKRQYIFGTVPMTIAVWQTLEGLYEVTDSGAYGFLAKDPKDDNAHDAEGNVTLVDAGTHTYQLVKTYTSIGSTRTKNRNITRPIASGFILRISGTPTGSYTLNVDTGRIVIPADPSAADVSWSGFFYTPIHFAEDEIEWELVRSGGPEVRLFDGPRIIFDEVLE